MMNSSIPSLVGLRARAVNVPMAKPLVTGGGTVEAAPLLLIDLDCGNGLVGRSYVFCVIRAAAAPMARLAQNLSELLAGLPLAPREVAKKLAGYFHLLGPQGLNGLVASAIDMAAWDALAKHQELPLCRLLGAAPRPLRAYNSKGLGLIGVKKAPAEALSLLEESGFQAVKVRLGYEDAETDAAVASAVKKALPASARLFSDYNQSLLLAEADRRIRRLDEIGLGWIEEPIRADNYAGYAALSERFGTPIQLGENAWGVTDMQKALAAGAGDLFMPDAGRIGGVTGWLAAAGLAEGYGLPLSSHLYPEISAHLLAATATADWLEYVDWAAPILRNPVVVMDGMVTPSEESGAGIEWDEAAVEKFSI